MKIQNINKCNNFKGHGAGNISDVMNKLYAQSRANGYKFQMSDILEFSTTMADGTEVHATANFFNGKFISLSFPEQFIKYSNQFCKKLLRTYNNVVTKGKSNK